MKEKFVIIDGNGLAYRAFYALPPLKTSRGEPMNAVYGFTNMLYQILEEEKPDYIAVAFDKSKPTVRKDQFEEYKAHRQRMPEELQLQFPFIEEVVSTLKIPIFWEEGYEADDCIATLARLGEEKGLLIRIYSGDLDMLQLVSPNTQVVTTRRGISDLVVYDEEAVRKRYGINPHQLVDYKALAGDSSDHIPGIPGIGEASASKILNQFESIEALYEKSADIPSRWRRQIQENKEQAFLSKRLASLEKNLPLEFTWEDLRLQSPDREELRKLFVKLEFKTMLKRLGFKEEEIAEIQEIVVLIVGRDEDLEAMHSKLSSADYFSIMLMMEENELVGMAIGEGNTNGYYIPFVLPENINISSTFGISTFSRDRIVHELKDYIENPDICKFIYDLKAGIPFLRRSEYFTGKNFCDLSLAAYLLEPENPPRTLEAILTRYTDFKPKTIEEILTQKKVKKRIRLDEAPLQDLSLFAAGRAVRINRLGPDLLKKLKEQDSYEIFRTIEMPLATILAGMENRGIKIDIHALEEETALLEKELQSIADEIYELAGRKFNINSSKQLTSVLYEELKIQGDQESSVGQKTATEALEKLSDRHPIVTKILRYREIAKQKSTFCDSIKNQIDSNSGKIHISFHQNLSPVGKITSSSPSLQQVPDFIKRIFIPSDPDRILLGFKYLQLDLRLLASFSGDENMIGIFNEKRDIYSEIAGMLFNKASESVTPKMRRIAEEVGNAVIYGQTAHVLSQTLDIPKNEAKDYINCFCSKFAIAKKYLDEIPMKVKSDGFAKTILGRKRDFPNIGSQNKNIRNAAEHAAINFIIQGSVADIIKKAMIEIFEEIARNHRDIHLLLQFDDELIFETKKRRADKYCAEIKRIMENNVKLNVPLCVKLTEGLNWKEMNEKTLII